MSNVAATVLGTVIGMSLGALVMGHLISRFTRWYARTRL